MSGVLLTSFQTVMNSIVHFRTSLWAIVPWSHVVSPNVVLACRVSVQPIWKLAGNMLGLISYHTILRTSNWQEWSRTHISHRPVAAARDKGCSLHIYTRIKGLSCIIHTRSTEITLQMESDRASGVGHCTARRLHRVYNRAADWLFSARQERFCSAFRS